MRREFGTLLADAFGQNGFFRVAVDGLGALESVEGVLVATCFDDPKQTPKRSHGCV